LYHQTATPLPLAPQKQTASVATITTLLILLLSVSEEERWVRPNKTTEKSGHSPKVTKSFLDKLIAEVSQDLPRLKRLNVNALNILFLTFQNYCLRMNYFFYPVVKVTCPSLLFNELLLKYLHMKLEKCLNCFKFTEVCEFEKMFYRLPVSATPRYNETVSHHQ
jgi:hypothetical protein